MIPSGWITKRNWIWQALIDLSAAKQGPAVFLFLTGKAKEAELERLKRLDKLYLQDTVQSAYLTCEQFKEFSRPAAMSMKKYLIEFVRLYTKVKSHNMVLPVGVLGYTVLNSANLDKQRKQLRRATLSELEYDEMFKQLKKTFDESLVVSVDPLLIKEEPVFKATTEETYYEVLGFRRN